MTDDKSAFKCLSISTLNDDSTFARAYSHQRNLVNMASSALEVMTDLHFVSASNIHSGFTITQASQQMISQGVRLLLVVEDSDHVIGLVTSRDFNINEMPKETKIDSVMTPFNEIEVMSMEEVLHAVVGDVVETLKQSKRQHALAAENDPVTDQLVIRGVFSATQISRQLGIAVQSDEILKTFEDIDQAVSNKPS